jgi:ElaB/YqjD/DUF883 family membrane-anchored ribosome-binding protein/uncharacterized protein YjbJ (UPF0337 family)
VAQEPFDSLTPPQRSEADTTAIKREIEKTRGEMSETIGEIQDRLRPDHLLQQAKDGVREAATGKAKTIMNSASETARTAALRARETGNHLAWYAREHPIRIAITAGVITWLALRSRASAPTYFGASDTSWEDDEYGMPEPTLRDRARDVASTARETVGEYASSARQAVGSATSTARETVGEYAASARDTVNEYAATAASRARVASSRVRSAASTATTSVDQWVHENPLAAGAVAVAVGAAIGLAVRSTEYEDRAMGATRDQALAKAKTVANNLKQNVTDQVATYAENVVGESLKNAAAEPPMGRA